MHIAVCGTGYTGIITAVVLCEFGHSLSCFDIDPELSESLKAIGLSEPGLEELITRYVNSKKLCFMSNLRETLNSVESVFITVPSKERPNLDINSSPFFKLFFDISTHLQRGKYLPLFVRTTVPVGTTSTLVNIVAQARPDLEIGVDYDIITNPNFMREGSAVHDLMSPDRVVFGLPQMSFQDVNSNARKAIDSIFLPLKNLNIPFLYTNHETAELIKNATMGLVTVKMAYMNELEKLCNCIGVELKSLLKGIGSDRRVSESSLMLSASIGGSSLPRISRLLVEAGKNFGVDLSILSEALISNNKRLQSLLTKISSYFKSFANSHNLKASIFGLSFKPFSDDLVESPSLYMIRSLLQDKIKVSVYDPYFLPKSFNVKRIPEDVISNNDFSLSSSAYNCVNQSNILIVMTDWPQFRSLDTSKIHDLMCNNPALFDCSHVLKNCDKTFQRIAA